MRELDKIAAELFDKIRSRFEPVRLGDESADDTKNPELARFYNFDYISDDGQNFGNITISIVDEENLKIVYGKRTLARKLIQISTHYLLEVIHHQLIIPSMIGIKKVKQLCSGVCLTGIRCSTL